MSLTKKAEPPPTRGVNRDSGTASANGGWLRRLVRHHGFLLSKKTKIKPQITPAKILNGKWLGISSAVVKKRPVRAAVNLPFTNNVIRKTKPPKTIKLRIQLTRLFFMARNDA
jgi:hypothetical protein